MGAWYLIRGYDDDGTLALADVSVTVDPPPVAPPPVEHVLIRPALGHGGMYARSRVGPREITLQFDTHRRGTALTKLRAALQRYCRLEGGVVRLRYAGALRTIEIDVYYVDGLDRLALRFIAPDPRWRLSLAEGETEPGGIWQDIIPVGTAFTYPTLQIAGPGTVTALTMSPDLLPGGALFFPGLTLASGEILHCVPEQMRFYTTGVGARQALSYLAPGSKPSLFYFVPGTPITRGYAVSSGMIVSCAYIPRYWSWEDADV
jgi:hypothetical protein